MSRPDAGPDPKASLHEQLLHRRKASELDLDALSHETKIQRRYFEAIELGQVHMLPQGIYMRNFIRIYLRAIGMDDPTELQSTIDRLTSGVLRLPMVSALPPAPRRQQDPVQARVSALMFGMVLLLAASGGLLGRYVQQARPGPDEGGSVFASATPVAAPPVAVVPTQAALPSPTSRPPAVGMALHAIRKASVVLKGQSGSETPMTLQKDETVEVYLGEPTLLEVSSAGAVEISIEGREVPMSRLRSSRTLQIDPSELEALFADLEATAKPEPEAAVPAVQATRSEEQRF
jgi:hypothetical protein